MTLTVHPIDGPIAKLLLSSPEFKWACGTSWDSSLLAIQRYVDTIEASLNESTEPLSRGFFALEFRSAVVELVEYVGEVVHTERSGAGQSLVGDSRVLSDVFKSVATGISPVEAAAILHLPSDPPECGNQHLDERLSTSHKRLLANIALCLAEIGRYWLAHIESTRWYRHCPAFLSVEDTYRIQPSESEQREEVRQRQRGVPDALFTFVQLDDRTFLHETIRREDVRIARHIMRAALAIVLSSFGNRVLDPGSPDPADRLRKIPRFLTFGIEADDLDLLCAHGPFYVAN